MVQVLDRIAPPGSGGDLLVTNDFADDAAVVRLDGAERGLVLTADVIAPLVDDPFAFGQIAATNAISDVYAMGGTPHHALNLVFFPDQALAIEVLHEILAGGAAACRAAGVVVVGGHTVRDPELKFGLSVTGSVAVDEVLSNRGARAGQSLVLSKPIGTGVIGSAIKEAVATAEQTAAAIASMTTHNAGALAIARRHRVTACTDVTGFGLLGHLRNLLRGSGVAAVVDAGAVPLLPGALDHAAAGRIPGGSRANARFLAPMITGADAIDPHRLALLTDAQTSGGLLLCLDRDRAAAAVAELCATGLDAAIVGELVAGEPAIELR